MERRIPVRQASLNVAKLVRLRKDAELAKSLQDCELVTIDGQGIAIGLRMFGISNADRIAGIDLFMALLSHCADAGRRPYILGAKQEVLDQALAKAVAQFPGLEFAGSHHGYFPAEHEEEIASHITQSGADCLFVAISSPAKERFIARHADRMDVPFIMGVGGSVDVLAGKTNRAPGWMQRFGMEWFFRLMQEPRRMFWRYASTNTAYALLLAKALLSGDNPVKRVPE